mgnify:CR=1 FL=1
MHGPRRKIWLIKPLKKINCCPYQIALVVWKEQKKVKEWLPTICQEPFALPSSHNILKNLAFEAKYFWSRIPIDKELALQHYQRFQILTKSIGILAPGRSFWKNGLWNRSICHRKTMVESNWLTVNWELRNQTKRKVSL